MPLLYNHPIAAIFVVAVASIALAAWALASEPRT